jgi:hypothetical protein
MSLSCLSESEESFLDTSNSEAVAHVNPQLRPSTLSHAPYLLISSAHNLFPVVVMCLSNFSVISHYGSVLFLYGPTPRSSLVHISVVNFLYLVLAIRLENHLHNSQRLRASAFAESELDLGLAWSVTVALAVVARTWPPFRKEQ